MEYKSIIRILGVLLTLFSFALLPPLVLSLWYQDGGVYEFSVTFGVSLFAGLIAWFINRNEKKDLRNRDGFLIVTLFYTVLSLFGAIPFIIGDAPHVSITDALFEAVSGFTATGTNAITKLDTLPHSILYYRQQLQFLGGMGVIVLAVAILPMLGIGGMSLYRAETPGPVKDTKLTPRLAETAKAIWYIYVGLVACCSISFHLAGMPWFNAIGESFSVLATGGFSMHDEGYMFYQNKEVEIIAIFFMILGATNFGLHYQFLRRRNLRVYWQDSEFRAYITILISIVLIVAFSLFLYRTYDAKTALLKSSFNVVSLITTTGLKSADFGQWPTFIPYLIIVGAIIGGCGASTSGGIKVIRALLLQRQVVREIKQLIHPKAVIPIKMGDQVLSDRVVNAIWGFLGVFVVIFVFFTLLLLATGLDVVTSFGAVAVCLSNAGAGIGRAAQNFADINTFSKWVLIFAMLAGRLEIFSLLVLLAPSFWKD